MPIADSYVVQYLLESSQYREDTGAAEVAWVDGEAGFQAQMNGLRLELREIASRTGSQIALIIERYPEKVAIVEPLRSGLMMRNYANEDQAELARLLRDLSELAARQCRARRNRSREATKHIREEIFRRLIGVPVAEPESVA